jgi:hypothetical protein
MIETALYSVLVAAATAAAGRVYPMERPENSALPAIVYQRVSTTPDVTLAGDSGLDAVRLQVACWASTYAAAKSLAAAARTAITGSASLKAITEMELDDRDEDTREYRVILDFRIWQ